MKICDLKAMLTAEKEMLIFADEQKMNFTDRITTQKRMIEKYQGNVNRLKEKQKFIRKNNVIFIYFNSNNRWAGKKNFFILNYIFSISSGRSDIGLDL